MEQPTFSVTDEQRMLRATVRKLLDEHAPSEQVRTVMMTEATLDTRIWADLAGMGLTGLLAPERHGGSGSTLLEVCVVMEELGRSLVLVPFLASSVLATTALMAAGTEEQLAAHLPGLASGANVGTLVHLDARGRFDTGPGVVATAAQDCFRLSGSAGYVLDGMAADVFVIAATLEGGLELFVVPSNTYGVQPHPVDVLDLTRPMAAVVFDDVVIPEDARLSAADAETALANALDAGAVAIASDQVGGARRTHEDATEYARTRIQFGRPIGSFQAIKHRLADLLVELESVTSTVMHAQRVLSADGGASVVQEERRIVVPLAKAYASEVYERIASEAIQVYGGLGFTWEHDVHLYLKRAKASRLLLGSPRHHRRALAAALGV